MDNRTRGASVVAIGALVLTGCAGGGQPRSVSSFTPDGTVTASAAAPARLLTPAAFANAVQQRGRVTVNVHVPFEGDIAGTDLSVPYDRVRARAGQLPPPGTPLAIYCRSGRMSAAAAPVLAELGYDDIVDLDGGMDAWVDSGRRLQGG